jgi:hypothetical protein
MPIDIALRGASGGPEDSKRYAAMKSDKPLARPEPAERSIN